MIASMARHAVWVQFPRLNDWLPPVNVAKRLSRWMSFALGYSLVVTLIVKALDLPRWAAGGEVSAMFGFGLGVLVVFRNNAAYDRWWEARKLWGQLINECRNLALKAHAHARVGSVEFIEFARLLAAFPHAVRLVTCGGGALRDVPGFADVQTDFPNAPGFIAGRIHAALDKWNRSGCLCDTLWILDVHARALMDVCGACERIRNTPLAASYRAILRAGIALYILTAPWSVVLGLGWWGLLALAIPFGFLLGVELTAEAIEEPFGDDGDDLPLERYCQTIESFVMAVAATPMPERAAATAHQPNAGTA